MKFKDFSDGINTRDEKLSISFIIFMAMISTIIVVMSLFSGYLSFIKIAILQERQNLIEESATQTIQREKDFLRSQDIITKTIVDQIRNAESKTNANVTRILNAEKTRWGFEDLIIVDSNNTLHYSNSQLGKAHFERISTLSNITEETEVFIHDEYFYFITTFPYIVIEDYIANKIIAKTPLKDVTLALNLSFYKDQGLSYVIDSNGDFLTQNPKNRLGLEEIIPEHEPIISFIDFMEHVQFDGEYTLDDLKNDLKNGNKKFIDFVLDGETYHLYMITTDISSWRLINIIPAYNVSEKSNTIKSLTITISIAVALVISILLFSYIRDGFKSKKMLERMAYTDTLTGAPNQLQFEKHASYLLKKTTNKYVVVYSNINKFKFFNERYGKESGDYILRKLKQIYESELQEEECFARIGSDNFAFLLKCENEDEITTRLQHISRHSSSIRSEKNTMFKIRIGFGVYSIRNRNGKVNSMLDKAHLALKMMTGKELYNAYDEEIKQQILREKSLEDKMNEALINNNFLVYLQPKVNLSTSKIVGAEALIRWHDPDEGLLSPAVFIPLFERNGFIVSIDIFVFETICSKIRLWLDAGLEVPVLSFNLSKPNIEIPNFLNTYKLILDHYNIPRKYIEFEFTETMVYDNVGVLTKVIKEIHDMNCSCSMDDFGSGYSSLNVLKDVNVDVLKLDKAFFDSVPSLSNRGETVVRSIIAMAKALNLRTISEGIETQEQVKFLQNVGCDYVQGYYFSKPLPIPDFEKKVFGKVVSI